MNNFADLSYPDRDWIRTSALYSLQFRSGSAIQIRLGTWKIYGASWVYP
ncbi:MAG: hypothetical protein HC827_17010 [Cyanobacteria bacterium RM1_2_2]|nr:hypothetical protein [Cyanobacteria bacterium RM1_2_2]